MAATSQFPDSKRLRVGVGHQTEKVSGNRRPAAELADLVASDIKYMMSTPESGHWKEAKTISASKSAPCGSMTAYERVMSAFPDAVSYSLPCYKVQRTVYTDAAAIRNVLVPEDGPNYYSNRDEWSKGLLAASIADNAAATDEEHAAVTAAAFAGADAIVPPTPFDPSDAVAPDASAPPPAPRSIFDPRGYAPNPTTGGVSITDVAYGGSRVVYSKFKLPLVSDRDWVVDESYVRIRHHSEALRRALLFGGQVLGDAKKDAATAANVAAGKGSVPAADETSPDAMAYATAPMETLILLSSSTTHKDVPEEKGCVRGVAHHTSFSITHHPAVPGRCVLMQVVASDPGGIIGSLPRFLVTGQTQSFLAQLLEDVATAGSKRKEKAAAEGKSLVEETPEGLQAAPPTPSSGA